MDALSTLLKNVHLYDTIFYCLKTSGDWSYSLNKKNVILFYLVVEGSFYLEVADETRELHVGDIVMITKAPSHIVYSMQNNKKNIKPIDTLLKPNQELVLNKGNGASQVQFIVVESQYDVELMTPLLVTLPLLLPVPGSAVSTSGSELMGIAVKVLDIASSGQGMGKTALVNRMASIIMIDCLRTHIESLPDVTENWLVALKDPYLAKALTVMHNEPGANWTINKLAEVAGMSRSSFAERFKDIVGVPPLTYLIDYRMRLAARYLKSQQHSISQISELVGYASDSTFSQAFKRVYGLSPRSYRRQIRATKGNKLDS